MSDIFHAGISGARGRMGRAVSQVLDAREDVVVAARFDRGETVDLKLCDVIIDFSTPEASVDLARACAARGGPALVIGSTGLSPEQDAEIEAAAEKIAIGIEMAKGQPPKNFRNEIFPQWHALVCRTLNTPSGKSITISRIIWNHHFEKLEIMGDDTARKVISKYAKLSNGN